MAEGEVTCPPGAPAPPVGSRYRVVVWLDPDANAARELGLEHWRLRARIHLLKGAYGLQGPDSIKVWYDAVDGARNGDVKFEPANASATCMTNTDEHSFVSLQFTGDELDPSEISAVLGIAPTQSYVRGESYQPGPSSTPVLGRMRSPKELIHRIAEIKKLIARQKAHAMVSCFWHSPDNAKVPDIDRTLADVFDLMGIELELDLAKDAPIRERAYA